MSALKTCPACEMTLSPAPKKAGLFGCAACGGVWADNALSQRIVVALAADLVRFAEKTAAAAAQSYGGPLPPEGPRACPECENALSRVHHASTTLDVCAEHGTWFDRGELKRVSTVLARERELRDPNWRSSDDYRFVSGVTALNDGGPEVADSGSSYRADGGMDVFDAIDTIVGD